ncbi:MAG: heme exporter protein CcmD [Gammaproteobacteria bacterium]|nr:heme exporter protein CcmD [Gammaproteobacteria bacterium]
MNEFLHMGGYAAYVWSAYGISLVVLILNIILPIRREQALLHTIKKKLQREASKP